MKNFSFEKSLKELNTIVDKMEDGELSLEKALQSFERGVELTRHCQKAINEAEQKVKILVETEEEEYLDEFEEDDE